MKSMKFLLCCLLLTLPINGWATREKQSLEAFQLSSLKIEAIYLVNEIGQPYVSIRDPKGYLHRAFRGDYIGKNFGLITEIFNEGLVIREITQGKDGQWNTREKRLLLIDARNN